MMPATDTVPRVQHPLARREKPLPFPGLARLRPLPLQPFRQPYSRPPLPAGPPRVTAAAVPDGLPGPASARRESPSPDPCRPCPPARPTARRSTSTSLTRSRNNSISRTPLPYINFAISCGVPSNASSNRWHSSGLNTTGTRFSFRASLKFAKIRQHPPQRLAHQKNQRIQRLPLRRHRHPLPRRQFRQKIPDVPFLRVHHASARTPACQPARKPARPHPVRLLRPPLIMPRYATPGSIAVPTPARPNPLPPTVAPPSGPVALMALPLAADSMRHICRPL